jgi:pyruvate kinase
VVEQLTLEWGVHPLLRDVAESLEELLETAFDVARDVAGLGSGDRVVITNGERPGAPGTTSVIIERALP